MFYFLFVEKLLSFNFIGIEHCFYQIYHVLANVTTNEHTNWRRYKYLQDGKGAYHNPFNRGWWINTLEYFFFRPSIAEQEVAFLNVTIV